MKIIKRLQSFIDSGRPVALVFSVTMAVLFVTGIVQAATTISTNISTSGTITGNYASSTVLSVNNTAFFGGTATTSINGAGDLLVSGSTTLQAFIGTSGTTTNLYSTTYLASGSTTLQAFTATQGTITSATSTNLYSTTFLASGSTTLQNFTFRNATSTHSNTATSTLVIGCIQMYATSTATAVRLEFGVNNTASTTLSNVTANGHVVWRYGTCPKTNE